MKIFAIFLLRPVLLTNQLMEDEIGRVCSMHDKDENCLLSFRRKILRKKLTWNTYAWIGQYYYT
jgi:hypothetical protein